MYSLRAIDQTPQEITKEDRPLLWRFLELLGISQSLAAKMTGVTKGMVWQWHTHYRPTIAHMQIFLSWVGGLKLIAEEELWSQPYARLRALARLEGHQLTPQEQAARLAQLREARQFLAGLWQHLATLPKEAEQKALDFALKRGFFQDPEELLECKAQIEEILTTSQERNPAPKRPPQKRSGAQGGKGRRS